MTVRLIKPLTSRPADVCHVDRVGGCLFPVLPGELLF